MLRKQLTVHAASARAVEHGNWWQRVKLVLAAAVTVSAMAACQSGGPEAGPTETPTATKATTSETAWREEYNAEELAAFDQATQTLDVFNSKIRPYTAAGTAPPAAKRILQQYRVDWKSQWQQLQLFADRKILTPGAPELLWTRADRIILSDQSHVEIRRCADSRETGPTEDGKPLNVPDTPVEVVTTMEQIGERWMIYSVEGTGTPCAAF